MGSAQPAAWMGLLPDPAGTTALLVIAQPGLCRKNETFSAGCDSFPFPKERHLGGAKAEFQAPPLEFALPSSKPAQ